MGAFGPTNWMRLLAGAALAVASTPAAAASPVEPTLANARLLGETIDKSNKVHIAYVHGMRADEPGSSSALRQALAKRLGIKELARESRCFLANDASIADLTYVRKPVWSDKPAERAEQLLASRVFVDRYEFRTGGGTRIIVDEINWWPLLHPLKCQFLFDPERKLSGTARNQLEICRSGAASGRSGLGPCDPSTPIHYPWLKSITPQPPIAGRAAWPNGALKRQIMNWGLADAVIALGPMGEYIRTAMQGSFQQALQAEGEDNFDRVIVAESLGSFVVMDALRTEFAVQDFVRKTADLYFFANQFALLELARLGSKATEGLVRTPESGWDFLSEEPLQAGEGLLPERRQRQILAISDPSDILTWRVPDIAGVSVINHNVRYSGGPFRLFANPLKAHRGAVDDVRFWNMLLKSKRSDERK